MWRLYRFRGVGELLYVGQTRQVALARLQQHLESKWWSPLATSWTVDAEVYYSLADVLAAEAEAIRRERPRCNDKHNGGNSGRWRSMADVPLELRPRGLAVAPVLQRPATRTRVVPGFWTRQRVAVVAVVVIWLAAFETMRTLVHDPRAAAVATAVPFTVTWSKTRRRRQRR
jgi:hypothetical protein